MVWRSLGPASGLPITSVSVLALLQTDLMSIIAQQAQARARKKRTEAEMEEMMRETDGSPMKSVLESLAMNNQVQPVTVTSKVNSSDSQISKASKVPQNVEEVPFR